MDGNTTQSPQPIEAPDDVAVSAILSEALNSDAEDAPTLGEIADKVADRGYGFVLVLLGLPTLIPILPPGASAVVGLLSSLIGLQMLVGLPEPWLPARVRRKHLSPKALATLKDKGVGILKRMERVSRRRWRSVLVPLGQKFVGLTLIAIGLVLFLPMPFMNTLPGIGITLIGIGILNRDGVIVVAGTMLCLVLASVVAFFGHHLVRLSLG
ncbi:MAG: exopolysaccharide biosynthesis protein [Armatimonadetes bacterium]|nr:exopolysaccharide biosynthesis protein [Armatimonadota bacterium]